MKSPRPLVPNIPEWSETATKVYDAFGLTEEQYWIEVKFTNKILQEKDQHDNTKGSLLHNFRVPGGQFECAIRVDYVTHVSDCSTILYDHIRSC